MPEVTVRWLDAEGAVHTEDGLAWDASRPAEWVWVDVVGPDADVREELLKRFDLHPLAIEDTEHVQARAKLDIFPDSLFFVWLTPEKRNGSGVVSSELGVFLGKGYLITLHRDRLQAVEVVAAAAARTMKGGPDWTLHAIIDLLVDSAIPLVDSIGDDLDQLEDDILSNPDPEDLRKLHRLRRQLTRLHRIASPERDILHSLARERDVISEDAYRYFLDVGDHVSRLIDSIETWQDVAASVMDVYLSAQSNRMNVIMKQLTVVATIFMPLTLLSGIYGMNTIAGMWPPAGLLADGGTAWAFWAVVGSMVLIALAMMAWFRRKNWW